MDVGCGQFKLVAYLWVDYLDRVVKLDVVWVHDTCEFKIVVRWRVVPLSLVTSPVYEVTATTRLRSPGEHSFASSHDHAFAYATRIQKSPW